MTENGYSLDFSFNPLPSHMVDENGLAKIICSSSENDASMFQLI